MSVQIKLIGSRELQDKLARLPDALQKKIVKKAIVKSIRPVLATAQANCPVKTGNAKASLRIKGFSKRGYFGARVITDPKREKENKERKEKGKKEKSTALNQGEQFYIGFYELGSKHQQARPFLRPALDSNKTKCIGIIRQEIQTELIKEAKK